ncbi:hypothetical protein QVH35_09435 [Candidatus Nitrosotenuis chungbukensis]|uniref:hypothetical protein n=1 Tax=Candidatus Nitrosotenuis chungbukensis TaxID=1353246 RepID=UPI0005B2C381|nr:hypothetical protein [Candidatus Nitrosotenuis chungbukensis]WKT57569.1 hypothetical protein QVH35_09435 [Candidatus Nitrosotenuis chungbukensis]
MSQILATKPKTQTLYYDLHFTKPEIHLHSTVSEATCHVCKKELGEGLGLTAKRIADKTILVCSLHN